MSLEMTLLFAGDPLPDEIRQLPETHLLPLSETEREEAQAVIAAWPGVADAVVVGHVVSDDEEGTAWIFLRSDQRLSQPIHVSTLSATVGGFGQPAEMRQRYVTKIIYEFNEYAKYVSNYLEWGAPPLKEPVTA